MLNTHINAKELGEDVETLSADTLKAMLKGMPKWTLYNNHDEASALYAQYLDANKVLKREFMPADGQDTLMFEQGFDAPDQVSLINN